MKNGFKNLSHLTHLFLDLVNWSFGTRNAFNHALEGLIFFSKTQRQSVVMK